MSYVNACLLSTYNQTPRKRKFHTLVNTILEPLYKYTGETYARYISAKHFDEYLRFGETHRPKT